MDNVSSSTQSNRDVQSSSNHSDALPPSSILAKMLIGFDPFWVKIVLVVLLWLAVVVSALSVVYVTHKTRHSLNELELLKKESAQLQVQRGRYLLEQGSFDAPNRIDRLARDTLNMIYPTADQTITLDARLRPQGE